MKLKLVAVPSVDEATRASNDAHARSLGFPVLGSAAATGRPLAIVGGGPSISYHLDTLRQWPGDVWAINGTYDYLRVRGIESTLFSVDPMPSMVQYAKHAERALLGSICDPSLFDALLGRDVQILPIEPFGPVKGGPTSACIAAYAAIYLGFGDVTFFGCESSFTHSVHAYDDVRSPYIVKVKCEGGEFVTEAEFLMQAEVLSTFIRSMPEVFKEQSGGLLRAFVEHGPEHDVVAASPTIMNNLKVA